MKNSKTFLYNKIYIAYNILVILCGALHTPIIYSTYTINRQNIDITLYSIILLILYIRNVFARKLKKKTWTYKFKLLFYMTKRTNIQQTHKI